VLKNQSGRTEQGEEWRTLRKVTKNEVARLGLIFQQVLTSGRSFSCRNSSRELGLSGGGLPDANMVTLNEACP